LVVCTTARLARSEKNLVKNFAERAAPSELRNRRPRDRAGLRKAGANQGLAGEKRAPTVANCKEKNGKRRDNFRKAKGNKKNLKRATVN